MTPLPSGGTVPDPNTERELEKVRNIFPLSSQHIGDEAVGSDQLATGYKFYDYGFVTALPNSPTPQTGYTCYLTDSLTAPTYGFDLVYNDSLSSKKWMCRGGIPIQRQDNDARTSSSTSFVDVPTDPISFDLPVAGDYDIYIGSQCFSNVGTGGVVHSYALEGTAASDDWGAHQFGTWQNSVSCKTRHTGLAAATTIAEKMRAIIGGTASVDNRRFWAMPVRVG